MMDSNTSLAGSHSTLELWLAQLRPTISQNAPLLLKEKTASHSLVKIPPKSSVHPQEKTYAGDDKKLIFSINSRTTELGCYRLNSLY